MAATTVDELKVLITAQSDQFAKEISRVQKQIGAMGKEISVVGKSVNTATKGMSASFGRVATAASAMGNVIATAAVAAFQQIQKYVGEAVTRLDTLKNYPRVMESLGYSATDAQKSIKALADGVLGLPTSLDDIVRSAQQLAVVSPNLKYATERALAFNDAMLAGGVSTAEVAGAMDNFNEILATGKPYAQNWNELIQVMPGQMNQVAQSMLGAGRNAYQLREAIEEGRFITQQFADEFVRLDKQGLPGLQSFKQQAQNATGGIATSVENMKTAFVRGLANILDAIGQSNIAAFFNGVAQAINNVIPYIVAFVKLIGQAVAFVSGAIGGLFGKKSTDGAKQIAKSAGVAGQAVGGIAAGAGEAADNLGGATKAAKKLQSQLASFDEMNVLQEPTTGGSGGGAGAGGASIPAIPIGEWDVPLNNMASKADQIAQSIKKALWAAWNSEPVRSFMSFLSTAWEAVRPNIELGVQNLVGLFTGIGTSFMNSWNEFAPQIGANIGALFNSIGTDIMLPALELAAQIFADFTGTLKKTWDEYGQGIMDGIFQFVNNIILTFKRIYDEILAPIIKPFLEELKKSWEESLKPMVDRVVEFVAKLISSALEIYNKFITPIINWLIGFLAPAFVAMGNTIGGVFNTVLRLIGDVVGGIFRALGGLIDFITGVFTGNWRKAWDGVKNIFGGIFDSLGGLVKAPINLIIDQINGFIAGINQVKVPDWVPGFGGKGINIPRIPKLATGGLITAPTLAYIGEAGREAVLPLDNNTAWMDILAGKITSNGQPLHLTVKIGEETILEKVVEGINDQSFMRNANVLTI